MSLPVPQLAALLVRRYGWMVVAGGLLGGGGGAGVALLTPKEWEAGQQLAVRDELVGSALRPGRFDSAEQLRSAQETVRSVARSREVIAAVLSQFEPPEDYTRAVWPDDEYVDGYRADVSVSAANGAEFGQTEVVVLSVRDRSPERAVAVTEALVRELIAQLSKVRDAKLEGMESELQRSLEVARISAAEASAALVEVETRIGVDLSELRSMNDPSGTEGPLRRQIGQTRQDLVVAQQRRSELKTQSEYLQALLADPERIASTPESLLAIHPELRRMKEGIIDSSLADSRLRAKYEATHPQVLAAAAAHRALTAELRSQLESAARGTLLELQLVEGRLNELQNVENDLADRIRRLAAERVAYAEAADRVQQRNTYVAQVDNELTEIRAARRASVEGAVIAPIGAARAGIYPVGPSRTLVTAAGGGGGIALACGLIALLIDPTSLRSSGRDERRRAGELAGRHQAPLPEPLTAPAERTAELRRSELRTGGDDRHAADEARPLVQRPSTTFVAEPSASRQPTTGETPHPAPVEERPMAARTLADVSSAPGVAESLDARIPGELPKDLLAHLMSVSAAEADQADTEADPERQRWQAIADLSDEIADLRDSIAQRRKEVLDRELARYRQPQSVGSTASGERPPGRPS